MTSSRLRRDYLSKPIFGWAKGVLPTMSDTEREALEAGDVWWDADLFTAIRTGLHHFFQELGEQRAAS